MREDIRIVPAADCPPAHDGDLEIRQGGLIVTGAVGLVAAGAAVGGFAGPVLVAETPAVGWVLGWWVGLWMAILARVFLLAVHRARGPAGWVLRVGTDHLLVNLRSYLNAACPVPEPTVLILPRARVRWLRESVTETTRPQVLDAVLHEGRATHRSLDLAIDADLTPVTAALLRESGRRSGPGRFIHRSVVVTDGNILRIIWRDDKNRLSPSLETVVARLDDSFRVLPASTESVPPISAATGRDLEDRLLDIAERGDRVEAITLARHLYGLDMTEAVQFIDELTHRPDKSGRGLG